jgi:hypothetical protein
VSAAQKTRFGVSGTETKPRLKPGFYFCCAGAAKPVCIDGPYVVMQVRGPGGSPASQ